MKYTPDRLPALACIASTLFFSLPGCGSSTKSTADAVVADAPVSPGPDVPAANADSRVSPTDAPSTPADVRATDAAAAQADTPAPDAILVRADAVTPDAASGSADAVAQADSASSDSALPRADAAAPGDVRPDNQIAVSDATGSRCNLDGGPATLVRLTPQELKAILDSAENPFLINVKGTSIANIPGTDAVLANDVAGIEKLVGSDLCADIILYCRTGGTSQSVASQLIAKGYRRIRDLAGGITAWTDAGYPTE